MGNINREHQPHAYRQDESKANFKQADRQSQNPYKREQLIHGTLAGIKVRSKGGLLISGPQGHAAHPKRRGCCPIRPPK